MTTVAVPGFSALALSVKLLSLPIVLKCGQSFRWTHHVDPVDSQEEWRLALSDRVVCLRQTPDTLFYRSLYPSETLREECEKRTSTLSWVKDYFQLDVDLLAVFSEVKDPVFQAALARFEGAIRILRQDPWENLMSFICSQNNHISRIGSMVQKLCTHFSPELLPHDHASSSSSSSLSAPHHPFPPPQALADPSVDAILRGLGFGYRAKYIQQTAALLCAEHDDPQTWLLSLRERPTDEAREQLLRLPGVGPKVADCILLMSLDKREVVPVDTHILQIAMKHYNYRVPGYSGKANPPMTPKLHADISAKLREIWGPYAGWAQGVLFTADLRAFAEKDVEKVAEGESAEMGMSGSPQKRKRKVEVTQSEVKTEMEVELDGATLVSAPQSRTRSKRTRQSPNAPAAICQSTTSTTMRMTRSRSSASLTSTVITNTTATTALVSLSRPSPATLIDDDDPMKPDETSMPEPPQLGAGLNGPADTGPPSDEPKLASTSRRRANKRVPRPPA